MDLIEKYVQARVYALVQEHKKLKKKLKGTLAHLECKPSPIHGKGLFTKANIRKDTIVGNCKVRQIKKPNAYTLWCENGYFEVQCILKYINHSKKPNVIYYDDFSVVALRNIKAGEELTHYYSDEL